MCRFLAYKGIPVVLDELLYQPTHSLINQSFKAREREEPLNGDGFGIGWYTQEIESSPGKFVSIRPAWNDRNLRSLSKKIVSDCFFAHVRAASVGNVSLSNCHPFAFQDLLFMHNGLITDFSRIKRELQAVLDYGIYSEIDGQTDSEHFFALILNNLPRETSDTGSVLLKKSLTTAELAEAVLKSIQQVNELRATAGITEVAHLNIALTDGKSLVATRYSSDSKHLAPSLYYSIAEKVVVEDGEYKVVNPDAKRQSLLVVSERLNDDTSQWHKIEENHLLCVDQQAQVDISAISA